MFAHSDLRYTGGTNPVLANMCDTSTYIFQFSPFVWNLTQFFWCDNIRIQSMGLIYKFGGVLHINLLSEEVLW
jgi:hypothetical protein